MCNIHTICHKLADFFSHGPFIHHRTWKMKRCPLTSSWTWWVPFLLSRDMLLNLCYNNKEKWQQTRKKTLIFNQLIISILERLICTCCEIPASGAQQITELKCQHNTQASIMHRLWTLETIKNKLCTKKPQKTNHYYSNLPDIIHRQLHTEIAPSIINGGGRKIWNNVMKWWTGLISHFRGALLCFLHVLSLSAFTFSGPNSVFTLNISQKKSKSAA